jgi:hypothetical protein
MIFCLIPCCSENFILFFFSFIGLSSTSNGNGKWHLGWKQSTVVRSWVMLLCCIVYREHSHSTLTMIDYLLLNAGETWEGESSRFYRKDWMIMEEMDGGDKTEIKREMFLGGMKQASAAKKVLFVLFMWLIADNYSFLLFQCALLTLYIFFQNTFFLPLQLTHSGPAQSKWKI